MGFSNLIPTMTSNTAPSGVVSAGSVYNSTYDVWKAVDGSPTTHWRTATGVTASWMQYKFDSSTICDSYTLEYTNFDNQWYMPYTWTFEASDTGSFTGEEVILDTQTAIVFSDSEKKIQFNFTNSVAYLYYRLNITAVNGGGNIYIPVIAFGVFAYESVPTVPADISITASSTKGQQALASASATITASGDAFDNTLAVANANTNITAEATASMIQGVVSMFTFAYPIQQSQEESIFKITYNIEQVRSSTFIERVSV